MPDKRLLAIVNECRERAEEILARAETLNDADAREGCTESLRATRNGLSGSKKRRDDRSVNPVLGWPGTAHSAAVGGEVVPVMGEA